MVQVIINGQSVISAADFKYGNPPIWVAALYKQHKQIALVQTNVVGNKYSNQRTIMLPARVTTKRELLNLLRAIIFVTAGYARISATRESMSHSQAISEVLGVKPVRGIYSDDSAMSYGTTEEYATAKSTDNVASHGEECLKFVRALFGPSFAGVRMSNQLRYEEMLKLQDTIDSMLEAVETLEGPLSEEQKNSASLPTTPEPWSYSWS